MDSDLRYKDRHAQLQKIVNTCIPISEELVKGVAYSFYGLPLCLGYEPYTGAGDTIERLRVVRSQGFEGLMLRLDNRGYEDGKRSSSLIKIKQFHDAEFECIDIVPSADGWGVCVLKAKNGLTFKASAPGDMTQKAYALANKSKFIGKLLTVEYSMLTSDGIPFHASAQRWREDI
jgi:ATP-dependent DNA ligase